MTQEAHDDAKARMTQAGARPINWLAVISEWAPRCRHQREPAIVDVLSQRAGTSSLWIDYVFAQIKAGLVQTPAQTR